MTSAVRAGLGYVAVVFAAGFALGVIRVPWLAPTIGETAAVLVELPVILAVAWVACGWLVRRFAVPGTTASRLVMGGVAFAVLMAAEFGVSAFGFGRSLGDHLALYRAPPALIGLVGQIAFALFPLVRRDHR